MQQGFDATEVFDLYIYIYIYIYILYLFYFCLILQTIGGIDRK